MAHVAISVRRFTSKLHSRCHRGCDELRFSIDDDVVATQLASSLATFVAKKVASVRITMRHFARRRYLEAAFHSLVSLLFWHFSNSETSAKVLFDTEANERLYRFSMERAGEYSVIQSGL